MVRAFFNYGSLIELIQHFKEVPLGGRSIQGLGSPVSNALYSIPEKDYKTACVNFLLYEKDGEAYVCYIKRKEINGDPHSGQISLAGGQLEAQDSSLEDCALRELEEEIGVSRQDAQLIRQLTPLYVYVSNFLVYPYITTLDYTPNFELQVSEVHSVLEVPLSYLSNPQIFGKTDIKVRGSVLKNVPYYDLFGHVLWGATAMMTSEFLHMFNQQK